MNRDFAVDRKASLLIVDDTPTNLAVLERMLRDDFQLVKALHARDALAAIERSSFDLILLDVMMPEMDGFEVLRRMKTGPNFQDTPVIFLTANVDTELQREGLALGAVDYLTKPFQRDIILLRIRNILQRQRLQRRLEIAMQNSLLGFWFWDAHENRLSTDDGGLPELSLAVEKSRGTASDVWAELCHPDDLPRLRADLRRPAGRIDLDLRLKRTDGSYRWFNLIGGLADSSADLPSSRISGTYRDVDERKREELDRFASEERLRHAISSSDKGVWDWDVEHNTLLVNAQCLTILGLPPSDPQQYDGLDFFLDRLPEDWREGFLHNIRQLDAPGNNHFHFEHQLSHVSGRLLWVRNTASVAKRDVFGRPTRLVGSLADATDHLEAMTRIISLMGQLDAILTLSPDGIIYFNSERRVGHINRSCERLLGQNSGELSNLTLSDLIGLLRRQSDATLPFPDLAALLQGDESGDRILTLSQPQRLVLRLHWQATRDGKTLALYLRDITHESEVDRMKSEFLTTAAHELRTPMASIMGFSELLLAREFTPERTRDLLDTIHRQSGRLTQLISELLDLARIESGSGQGFTFVRQALLPVLQQALAAVQIEGDQTPISLAAPPPALPELEFDADRIQQALINVLSNAKKYSPYGGAVEVSLRLRESVEGKQIGVCVQDRGIGMTPEQLSRVFERFYRADPSQTIPGTGLGMSVVKEIMEIHGGSVEIESEFGIGTRVLLWLPLERATGSGTASRAPDGRSAGDDSGLTLWLDR